MTRRLAPLLALLGAALLTPVAGTAQECRARPLDPARLAAVTAAFEAQRPALAAGIGAAAAGFTPARLYDLQMATAPLLHWAAWHGHQPTIERLAALYDRAFENLAEQSSYSFFYLCEGSQCPRQTDRPIKSARLWTYEPLKGSVSRHEEVLHSSQFAFAIARIVSHVAATPRAERGDALPAFVARWLPVLLEDHYLRWALGRPGEPGVWERAGWGCGFGNFTLEAHWRNLAAARYGTAQLPRARAVGYCNAITDESMWVAAGVAELLMARRADPRLVPIAAPVAARLEDFVRLAVDAMAARTTRTRLTGSDGQALEGRVFDAGAWDAYPDHAYSADEQAEFPGWQKAGDPAARPPRPAQGTAWDISHGRRLVNVLDSLRRATAVIGTRWPSAEDMAGFARQFAFGVAREAPDGQVRFTNYFDGTNGWYRVNYSSRPAFGYPPFGLSKEAAHGGYGFWGAYEPRALSVVRRYVERNPPSGLQRLMVEPSLEPVDSEPSACPAGQAPVR